MRCEVDYTKDFKEREELIRQLEERGLEVPDPEAALRFLTRVGYFRSGAYRYVLRELLPPEQIDVRLRQYRSDQYAPGASFDHVEHLEAFARNLRAFVLKDYWITRCASAHR